MAQSYDADQVAAHEKATWDRCASIDEATLVPLTQTGYTLVAETGLIGPARRSSTSDAVPASSPPATPGSAPKSSASIFRSR